MQTRENMILSITPILRNKMFQMLNIHPDWNSYEVSKTEKVFIRNRIPNSRHGQQNIPKHGNSNSGKHGYKIVQDSHGIKYEEYYDYINKVEIEKASDFVENNLDAFVRLCSDCFKQLNQSDCESIGTQFPTQNAQKLYELLNYLIQNGFPGPRDFTKPINFWSGDVALKKASENQNEISGNEIPAISILFDVCQAIKKIQGYDSNHTHLIESCIMRIFASHAKGIASVYISSDKPSENAGFTTQNFFWSDELVVLQELKKRGVVRDIQVHLYDHEKKQWNAPVNLSSSDSQHIPIRTRSIHPLDSSEIADRFKKPSMTVDEKLAWKKSLPRPEISFGRMKEIARTWQQKAEYKQKLDKIKTTLKAKCEELSTIYKQDIEREWQNFNTAYYINIGVNTGHLQYKNPKTTEENIQEFKRSAYYIQTKAKLDVLEFMKKSDSIDIAKTCFEKNKEIFAVERDKYKTRILRGIVLIFSFGLSYGLSDAKNLSHYFTHTRSSGELENILESTAFMNMRKV